MKKGKILAISISFLLSCQVAAADRLATDFNAVPAEPNAVKPSVFMYEAKPGQTIEDALLVQNTSNEKSTIYFYGADSMPSTNGKPSYRAKGEEMKDIGKWLTFSEESYEFAPQENKRIPFKLVIPEGTEQKDYKGAIAVEKLFKGTGSVNTALRVAESVELKVTENPQEISLVHSSAPASQNPTLFFWITIGIFAVAMAYLFISRSKKHEKKHR